MKRKDSIHDNLLKQVGGSLLIILLFLMAGSIIEADWSEVADNRRQAVLFLEGFLKPEWSYIGRLVDPMIETVLMSVSGTFLGVVLAIPAAFLGTNLVTRNPIITFIFRTYFSLIRTIPNLLLAALLVAIIGIGELTGVLTIAIFTFGMVSQLIFSTIETIEIGPLEADESIGATRFQIAVNAVWPQVAHSVFAYALYAFEVNVRASAVLGYVGAGGIGVMLNTALSFMQFGRVSLIILIILLLVFLTSWISEYIRREVF